MQAVASRPESHRTDKIKMMLVGAARASHWSPAVEQLAVSPAILHRLPKFDARSLSRLLWALAKLDCRPPGLWDPLEAAIPTAGDMQQRMAC